MMSSEGHQLCLDLSLFQAPRKSDPLNCESANTTFRVPFSFAPSPLSESLEQATLTFKNTTYVDMFLLSKFIRKLISRGKPINYTNMWLKPRIQFKTVLCRDDASKL